MNYRHAFHAGNFADVLKHAVLARLVTYLKRKDKPFRVIDTHAGVGVYDLTGEEAARSPEWRDGIARLLAADLSREAAALLAPYLDVVRAMNPAALTRYPGSPVLVRALLRRQDRLSAIELHPADHGALAAHFEGDPQTRVTRLDGWLALGAHVPPKERRGLVLVDPPFEAPGEFDRLAEGAQKAVRRFAGGLYALWYPRKDGAPVEAFHAALQSAGLAKMLVAELDVREARAASGLSGSGLVLINPPFTLEDELAVLLPDLARILGDGEGTQHSLFWLSGEG